jgi:hypothetical protein
MDSFDERLGLLPEQRSAQCSDSDNDQRYDEGDRYRADFRGQMNELKVDIAGGGGESD